MNKLFENSVRTLFKYFIVLLLLLTFIGLCLLFVFDEEVRLYQFAHRQMVVGLIIFVALCLSYFIMPNFLSRRYSLFHSMKVAIKSRAFYPVYQPIFDRQNNRYCGVEVLLRWKNNEPTETYHEKIIMPDLFIAEAEANGLIVPITLQIIEQCFIETQAILKKHQDFYLGFNISASHFTDTLFFKNFFVLIKRYAIAPEQIILELTERDLIDKNNTIFFNTMRKLRQANISLAVDDYGTGHASISYLHHFPFNYLKIDKLFIQSIGTKAIIESLNDVIISMAKRLQLTIIAEGVETEEQLNYLASHDVRYLQGWYFSKALPIEKLEELLES